MYISSTSLVVNIMQGRGLLTVMYAPGCIVCVRVCNCACLHMYVCVDVNAVNVMVMLIK